MSSYKILSSILRGRWLVQKEYADSQLPLIVALQKGDSATVTSLLSNDSRIDRSQQGSMKPRKYSFNADTTNDPSNNEDELTDDDELDNDPNAEPLGNNVYEVSPYTNLKLIPKGSIAYLDIDGVLMKQGNWCSWGMEDWSELFYGLKYADNIDAVILDIDSPGGQCDGTATLADAIVACKASKPVIAFVDDGLAASAAYWVISACSEIYCSQPTDAVGSIGVYCTIADYYAYYQHEGLPIRDVYAPQSIDKNQDVIQALNNKDELLKSELAFLASTFIDTVNKNRKGKVKGADWEGGKMYFANDAIKQGLIDGIKGFDAVVKRTNSLIPIKENVSTSPQNNNNMAFKKIMATAGIPAIAVVDGGFLMQEADLNKVEAALSAPDNAAAANAATITQLTADLAAANAAKETSESNLVLAQSHIATLEGTVAALSKQDGADPIVAAATEGDQFANTEVSAMDMQFQKELLAKI